MKLAAVAIAFLTMWPAGGPHDRGALLSARVEAQAAAHGHGIVHGDGHAFVDAGGPFLARGATLFWGLWGYQQDRARLGRNLATLRDWGFDYVRVLGVVGAPGERPGPVCGSDVDGCDSWRDRRLDPTASNYARDIAGFTDWAYKEYGLRVQWTIFGGTDYTPTPESRRTVVEMFADISSGREPAIFAFEIANESWQNGFSGEEGRKELRALARLLKARSSNLVALSSPETASCAEAQELYRDSPADLMTMHIARVGGGNGEYWTALREIWDLQNCGGVPTLVSSNEPIGPESSVVGLDDPVALSAMALVTYGSGIGAFVFHTGPGVRGGGAADLALGRRSNLWELPSAPRIVGGFASLLRLLPGNFANWSRQDALGEAPDRPFDAKDRAAVAGLYCFSKAPDFACAPVGITKALALEARHKLTVTVHDLVTGTGGPTRSLTRGETLAIPGTSPAVLIRGRLE